MTRKEGKVESMIELRSLVKNEAGQQSGIQYTIQPVPVRALTFSKVQEIAVTLVAAIFNDILFQLSYIRIFRMLHGNPAAKA